jgi:hypothetical protein
MIFPTVHLNGTSRNDLLEQYREMLQAVSSAIRIMNANGPNGRDYYPQGPDAITRATEEHHARTKKLIEVQAELNELCESCFE